MQNKRTIGKSALIGALRGLAIAFVLSFMFQDDINLDLVGFSMQQLSTPVEAQLWLQKMLIITPLILLVGAVAGIVIDKLRDSSRKRFYRQTLAVIMPILFLFIVTRIYVALSFSHQEVVFSRDSWQHGLINERFYMVNDLLKRQKLVGMSLKDVLELLGESEPDAEPRHPKSDCQCLAYDLGHRSTKYGSCLALYYKDGHISDYEVTFYKFCQPLISNLLVVKF